MGAAGAHGLFRLAADAVERVAQRVLALGGIEGAVDLGRRLAHVAAHGLELGVGQHRAVQRQHVALRFMLIEDVAQIAQAGAQAHHPRFAQAVDRRVGDLAEVLAEEMVQAAIMVGQHRQRRVVAHGADRFLAFLDHGLKDQLHVLHGQAIGKLAALEFLGRQFHRLGRAGLDQAVQLGDVLGPLAIGLAGGQHVLEFGVAVQAAGLQVHGDGLAGSDAALFHHVGLGHLDHAGFGTDDQQAVLGDGDAHGPQAVAVHAGDHPAAIGGADGGRAVPRLDHGVAIAEEGAVAVLHQGVRAKAFRHQHLLDHGSRTAGAAHHLEHVVERRRIRTARLDHRLDVLHVLAERLVAHARLVRLHPVDVAGQRVDLAVMGEHAERLGQAPGGEGVGGIALVVDGEARHEALVQQIGIEAGQLLGQEHALVDDRAARQRADVEIRDVLGQHALLDAAAQQIEVGLEPLLRAAQRVGHHDLLDLGPRGVGLLADNGDVHRHLAPAIDGVAEIEDLGLDDAAAAFLGAQIGLGQEDHAQAQAAGHRLVAGVADMVLEEVLRQLDVDAGAVAGLAVGVHRAAMEQHLQRLDAGDDDVAARLAVKRCHQTDAAGVVRRGVDAGGIQLGLVLQILGYELLAVILGHGALLRSGRKAR